MNKQELKKILKPLIKECIKETLFEDGILSGIISEVMQGVSVSKIDEKPQKQVKIQEVNEARLNKQKKKMLDAIGKDAYNGVNLFEGTTPAPAAGPAQRGPLSGTDPTDPGVDLSQFIGANGAWKKLVGG